MTTKITVDPVTRIEGHLRIDCEVNNGRVTRAWASGQMWRGIEQILAGRDPRDAWIFAQRICGVCTTVHAIASVRAVENALDMEIPPNAQYLRNMIMAAHAIHDHIVHFYHLSALDWVDVMSALKADPTRAARLAESLSDWPLNGYANMHSVQDRLAAFMGSGQPGIFANGYWGHPAMTLVPEANLMVMAHYLQALEVQRKATQIVSVLGGKSPHIQNLAVGGVTNTVNSSALNLERLMYIKGLIDELESFIRNVYFADVCAIAASYPEWMRYGTGVTDYLCVPDMPLDAKGAQFDLPGGYIANADPGSFKSVTNVKDEFLRAGIRESAKHAWYRGDEPLHPWQGETLPDYTDFQDQGKYSWVKSPTFHGKPAQVGPLAHVLGMAAAGHEPTQRHLSRALEIVSRLAGTQVPPAALHSTIGRHVARAVRCAVLHEALKKHWQLLVDNIARGDNKTYARPEFPRNEVQGVGFHEAPRGLLSHWVVIDGGRIRNYQVVVPTTWNAAPRNAEDAMGPYEAALLDNPIADPEQPLEVLRTVHSFDPCLACAVHLVDTENDRAVTVKVV